MHHLNLKQKRNIFLYRLVLLQESFIIHQVPYSLFTLVWRHSLFQLTNSLIQKITAFIGVIIITDVFSHNTEILQWMDCSWNYACKSALLAYANSESPDVTECNRSLWSWPACFYEPVSLTHTRYTSALGVRAQQCWVSQRSAAHCRE